MIMVLIVDLDDTVTIYTSLSHLQPLGQFRLTAWDNNNSNTNYTNSVHSGAGLRGKGEGGKEMRRRIKLNGKYHHCCVVESVVAL